MIQITLKDIFVYVYIKLNSEPMKKYISSKIFDISDVPESVTISTMSTTCKVGTTINIENINKYMELSEQDVITIKYNKKVRSLDKKVKKKKVKKNFFNQITLEIRPSAGKKINVKLFRNGSVQMTGCKTIKDCNIVLNKLVSKLSEVYGKIENGKIVDVKFVDDIEKINITDFKIDMINSNFSVDYDINRESLYNILLEKKVTCRYEPCIHACVNIKYKPQGSNQTVSIFVFQSGSIIITGAKNNYHITKAYEYINRILRENYTNILKKDVASLFGTKEFNDLIGSVDVEDDIDL